MSEPAMCGFIGTAATLLVWEFVRILVGALMVFYAISLVWEFVLDFFKKPPRACGQATKPAPLDHMLLSWSR